MPAYVVVQITVEDPVVYAEYKRLAPPSIAAYGGRYIVRGGATEILEGSWRWFDRKRARTQYGRSGGNQCATKELL